MMMIIIILLSCPVFLSLTAMLLFPLPFFNATGRIGAPGLG
jgi:hypothetical protein